jgi:hypothetical protein
MVFGWSLLHFVVFVRRIRSAQDLAAILDIQSVIVKWHHAEVECTGTGYSNRSTICWSRPY